MIATGVLKTLLSGAVGVIAAAGAATRHAAWYVRYRVDGTVRDDAPPPISGRSTSGRSDGQEP